MRDMGGFTDGENYRMGGPHFQVAFFIDQQLNIENLDVSLEIAAEEAVRRFRECGYDGSLSDECLRRIGAREYKRWIST